MKMSILGDCIKKVGLDLNKLKNEYDLINNEEYDVPFCQDQFR
jgi:hypothetical protein